MIVVVVNKNCEAILAGQNAGFALVSVKENAVIVVVVNKNCEAILAGQNAGFALVYDQKNEVGMKKILKKIVPVLSIVLILTSCGEAEKAYKEGVELAGDGKFEESLPYFEKALGEEKDRADYYIAYGMALNRLNRYQEAKEEFGRVMQETENKMSQKNNKQLYYGMAVSAYGLGEYDDVVQYCGKALGIEYLEDMDCDILYTRMLALSQQGEWEQAESDCREIIKKDDEYFDAWLALARIERNMGKNDEAVKAYLDVIDRDKEFYDAYFELYEQYRYSGQEDAANELLDQLIAVKMDTGENMLAAGRAYYCKGQNDEAKRLLNKAYGENCVEAGYYTGVIYAGEGAYDEAVKAFQDYIEKSKEEVKVEVYYQMALVYLEQREYGQSQDAIDKGISFGCSSALQDLRRTQVILYEKQNQYKKALKSAKEYLKIYPSDAAMEKEMSFIKTRMK